jgi:hypothetical protein
MVTGRQTIKAIQMGVFSSCSGMVWRRCLSFMALMIALLATSGVQAQAPSAGGQVSIPESSVEKPGDNGVRAHTNIQIYHPNRRVLGGQPSPDGSMSRSPQGPGQDRVGGSARPQ